MIPSPGQIVRARSRQYLVEDVVPPPQGGDDTLVRLSCLDDDVQGEPLDVLWEHELDAEVVTERDWSGASIRDFDAATRQSAWISWAVDPTRPVKHGTHA